MQPLLPSDYAEQYRNHVVPWGYNGLGEMVYARTYARFVEGGSRKETWAETVLRVVNGAQAIGSNLTSLELETLYEGMMDLKCSLSGRALWQLGTPMVETVGGGSLLNCSIVPIADFPALMDMLMLGTGVGYSVERQYVYELPRVRELDSPVVHEATNDADFIVSDKREGWSELLQRVLNAYFVTGRGFTYSTVLLRSAGAPLKTFGGTSSGPLVLIDGITDICKIIDARAGKKLRSIDCLDIANIIGRIVVAGNARRSAQLALGDPDDHLYARAKNWSAGNVPAWRANANVSIAADSYEEIPSWYWRSGWDGSGEVHGLLNVGLARRNGRAGEKANDRKVVTTNPCGEIFLEPYETCNLATLFLPNIDSYEELTTYSRLLYKVQKATALYRHQNPHTHAVQQRNLRLGQSITGVAQVSEDRLDWLSDAYIELREFDVKWSEEQGVRQSIKLTAVQPSGTLSLLPGVTPGVHAAQARHYIRRVRFAADDPLVDVARRRGYSVVADVHLDGTENHNQLVVEFPASAPDEAILMEEMSAVRQMELVARMQAEWADNAVSVTVNYRDEEVPAIKEWLAEHYTDEVKSISFLRHSDHNFPLPPYETIDAETYDTMASKVDLSVPLYDAGDVLAFDDCEGGACPVR